MGAVDPLKVPSSAPITCSEKLRYNPNYVNISLPKIMLYLHLAESST